MPICRKTLFTTTVALISIVSLSAVLSAQDGSPSGKCGFQKLTINSPAGTTASPTTLNDNGAMVGFLGSGSGPEFTVKGFLLSGGRFTSFRFPGSRDTFAWDINNNGVIVGSFDTTLSSGQRAFMVHSGGFTEVKIPGFPNAPASARGVNDFGHITGQFNGNGSSLGFLLRNGRLTILSFPGAKGGTFPVSINNQDVVVGTYHLTDDDIDRGFMWKNGVFTNITPPGAGSTQPAKVNNLGDIAGTFIDSNITAHGFALDHGRFSTIDPPGSVSTRIVALNKFDNILGVFTTSSANVLFKGFCSSLF